MQVKLDFEIHKIQEIRLVQALIESGVDVEIPENQKSKFELLERLFDLDINKKHNSLLGLSDYIDINHQVPYTIAFNQKRVLIFPKSILEKLKLSWKEKRKYDVVFIGLITPKREVAIENWLQNSTGYKKKVNFKETIFLKKIIKKIYKGLNLIQIPLVSRFGVLSVISSTNGRAFPIKSWDSQYYNFLLDSRFVLCPSGDFIWTYRFFEAILCGSFPIVEESCKAYEGFYFYKFGKPLNDIVYDEDKAFYNYNLCIERLTI